MSLSKNYSSIDRFLHYLAFDTPFIHKTLCDLENDIFSKQLASVQSANEVFVTALPRAGTTLVLELLYRTDEFSTFSYRHMPFIMAPLLWKKFSKPFAKKAKKMQRAHGDGMDVSFDSPEAFEEVIWLSQLRNEIVHSNHLKPLSPDIISKHFSQFFSMSIKKLLLEKGGLENGIRYLSKNNANCSRIAAISKMFPNSTIIVPFREPLAHVGSLLKIHQQFSAEHAEDSFSKKYMAWIGHYDIGANFKPIDFDHWLKNRSIASYDETFWLEYWTAAYRNILAQESSNICFINFDQLLLDSKSILTNLADRIKLKNKEALVSQADMLRSPTSKPVSDSNLPEAVIDSAHRVHEQLMARQI